MTTEIRRVRRTSFKPHAFLAAFGLALAFLPSAANAGNIPLLSSATLTTGTDDQARAVARDGAGNLFVVGYSSAGGQGKDIWVSRWNESTLTVISSRTFNGTGNSHDMAEGVARDDSGNVFVSGVSSVAGAGSILWLGKFDPSMVFVSSITYPIPMATNTLESKGIVIAPGGNLFVVKTASAGNTTAILAQFTPALAFVSSTSFFNGFDQNYGFGLARDSGGNLYMSGSVPPSFGTTGDIWVGKFNSSLVLVASATVAGPGGNFDQARGIVLGSDGNVYVSGTINNTGGIVDLWVGKYSPALGLLDSAAYPSPVSGNATGNAIAASSDRIYTAGQVAVSGQGANAWITELDYNLTMQSSGTYTSAGATTDENWGLAIDTMTGAAYAVGMVTPSVPQIWVAKYQLSNLPSFPGCAVTNNVGAGQAFGTIQAAVSALPMTLPGHSCVVIRDGATYNEQVTVAGFTNNGSSITIRADAGFTPVVSPPAASTAAFVIKNASVTIQGIGILVNQSVPYGVWASSAYAQLSGVSVSTSGSLGIYEAGVRLGSFSSVSYSSVTAWNAHGILLDGAYASVVNSTASAKHGNYYGLYLLGADSNTVTGSTFQNPEGSAVRLDAGSDYNVLSNSFMSSNRLSYYALYFSSSDGNTAAGLKIANPSGNGIAFYTGADGNTVGQSTVVSNGNGQGIAYVDSDWNTLTDSYVQNLAAWGVYIHTGADNNTVSLSTVVVNSAIRYALYIHTSASNTITQSVLRNPAGDAARLEFAHYNTISQSTMASEAGTKSALYLTRSSFNVITQSLVSNTSGYGAQLLDAGYNTISQSNIQNSTSTSPALKITATGPGKAVYNLIERSDVFNSAGHAGMINFGADNNDVYRSTFTSNSSIHRALEINSVSSTTVTQSYMMNSAGYGLFVSFSTGVSIDQSRMESSTGFGLFVDVSSGVKSNGSKAQGNPAVYIRSSTQTQISGEVNTFGGGRGLWIANGNVGVSASFLSIFGASATDGIFLDGPNTGPLSFSSITIAGPNSGFSITAQPGGAILTVASMTFQGLSVGATAVNFIGGTFVATFSGVNFADGSIGVNVNAASLGGGSRITMAGPYGPRAGPGFETDPSGYVDWPPVPGLGVATFGGISGSSLTANWTSTFPGGTSYVAELSTGGFPNSFLGNQSSTTFNLFATFGGLNGGTLYFARVSTNGATGPYTNLGSTLTAGGVTGITALPYTSVSAASLAANWSTSFPGGTVYYLQISTNAFATINAFNSTTNNNFFYSGLNAGVTYSVRVSTLNSGGAFTNLGPITTPAGDGGAINFNFFNNTGGGAVVASANGQNETGLNVLHDPYSPGGPYTYLVFASTPGATASRNDFHDTAGVVGLAKYGPAGALISSRTLAIDSDGPMAADESGNLYVGEMDKSIGANSRKITKYGSALNPLIGVVLPPASSGAFGQMLASPTSVYAVIDDANDNTIKVVNYDMNLVALATAAPYSISGNPLRSFGFAGDDQGYGYVLVSSAAPNAPVRLLKYNASSAGALNGSSPLTDVVITGVTSKQKPSLAVAAGWPFVAFTDAAGTSIIVRKFDSALNYTGVSSTITNIAAPFGDPRALIKSAGSVLFVGGTANTGGGGDYFVMKLDAINNLAFISSAAFNSVTFLADQAVAMSAGLGGEVYVTGASSDTIANANAVSVKFVLAGGSGVCGSPVVSAGAVTGISTNSMTFNWTPHSSCPASTLFTALLSSDGFSTVSSTITTTNPYAAFTGLGSGISYAAVVSTTGQLAQGVSAGSATTTNTSALAISGIISYPGQQPGPIRVEAFTNAIFSGGPANSQVLPSSATQSYYLTVAANTYYLRAYPDVLGGGAYQVGIDSGTIGPIAVAASSVTGQNFSISADSVPPAAVIGVSASPSAGQIYLTWAVPSTNANGSALLDLRGYVIERSTGGGFNNLAGSPSVPLSSSSLNFIDFAPVPNVTNSYRVIAVDFGKNQSSPSAPASVAAGGTASGGSIYGQVSSFTVTGSGTFRVRLSTSLDGGFLSESNQNPFGFTGLSTGTYYLKGFRDLDENGVQGGFEPAGTGGGLHNNPYPIFISGTNTSFMDVAVCDRALLQPGFSVNGTLVSNGCPALDAGPNRRTNLLAFEAGTGAAGSISTGTALAISMSRIYSGSVSHEGRLVVIGPNGQIVASNSAPQGAAVSFTPTAFGVYVVEPTSNLENHLGTYTVTMNGGLTGAASDGIAGTVSYGGAQGGNTVVRFFSNSSFMGIPLATQTVGGASGPFTQLYLPAGTYTVDAYRDTSGSGFNPSFQAYGKCNGGAPFVSTGTIVNIGSCTLNDPASGTTGTSSLAGNLYYPGAVTGQVRTGLYPYGSNTPARFTSTAFAANTPFSFTAISSGSYIVKSFIDANNNFVPDPNEPVVTSTSSGFYVETGVSRSGANFTLCDRNPVVPGTPLTFSVSSVCPAPERAGSFMSLYTFNGQSNQPVTITAEAVNFSDSYLYLYDPNGNLIAIDDDSGGSYNAKLSEFLLPLNGVYTVGAGPYGSAASGQVKLTVSLSGGALGSIAGDVSYSGTQGGNIQVALFDSIAFSSVSFVAGQVLTSTRVFQFPGLLTNATYYLGAFVDVNYNNNPDQGEDGGVFGTGGAANPIYLLAGQNISGATIVISPSTATAATSAHVTGSVYYSGSRTGQLILEFWPTSQFTGSPVAVRNIPTGVVASTATYDVTLPGGANYYLRAFLDANNDYIPNPDEPKGVYAPNALGAEAVYAPANQVVTGINVTMKDPGVTASGVVAGEGSASLSPPSLSPGQQATLQVIYTVGATTITTGTVGFSAPYGFPFPGPYSYGSSVTVRSTATATFATNYNGPSAFVNVTAGSVLPGQKIILEWSNFYVPCAVGVQTVTVSAVPTSAAPPAPLFGGSPAVSIAAGVPFFFQPRNPYFSLLQGEVSEAQVLEAKDSCGNRAPLVSGSTVSLHGAMWSPVAGNFVVDPDVNFSAAVDASTSSNLNLYFAAGVSTRAFYVVGTSTGFHNMQVFFNLGSPSTYYYGLSVVPANALAGVSVSSSPAGQAASSTTIGAAAGGGINSAFVNFTLGDPEQSWRVLFSSVPLRPDVYPTPVWERWGYGQPNPGEIVWDGRFNPWINGGARVPNGLYHGRVELGQGGVRNDNIRVAVSLPQFAGRAYDSGTTPNPPLSGVQLRVYGPSGYFTATSGADGSYVLPGLGAGTYRVNLSRVDYVEGVIDLTLNASGAATSFVPRTPGVLVSSNATGGLDLYIGRSPRLTVVPSLDASIGSVSNDQWGSLQVRPSTTSQQAATYYGPMRLQANTTTFDDGGQWDSATQQFVARTLLGFNVPVGTYTVVGDLYGYSQSTGTVYVGPSGARLDLTPFLPKSVITGQVNFAAGAPAGGLGVGISAIALSTTVATSNLSGGTYINGGSTFAYYSISGFDPGSYLLRANTQGLSAITLGPVVVAGTVPVTGANFPNFGAGASITGTVTITGGIANGTRLYINAWSPGSFNFGSTTVYTTGGAAPYALAGLDAGATYQLYANIDDQDGGGYDLTVPAGGFPIKVNPTATQNFTLAAASGVVAGTIILPAGATDFVNVTLNGLTIASLRPNDVGRAFVEVSTTLPNFRCGDGSPANAGGYCPIGVSSATFKVHKVNTETLELRFFHSTSGQTSRQIASLVNGSTYTLVADLSAQTHSISGSIIDQITDPLFNTNDKIVANAPYIRPQNYPPGLSSTTARVTAIRQEIDNYGTAISTVFNPVSSRVGFIVASGTFTIPNVPNGAYLIRTPDLRSCATCPIVAPSVSRLVTVAGASVSSVTLTLSNGYSVSGTLSLDGGLLDSRVFEIRVLNRRQEVVRSTAAYLGDIGLGVTAGSVDYAFSNLPAGEFYTLIVKGLSLPVKYAGRPIRFPDPGLSPNGLQSNLTGQNVLLHRAAYVSGRMKDGATGELIGAANASLLAPNFAITATANPWTEGGFVAAASSISARPVEGDGYFRVGPLLPNVSYDLRLAQATWDPNFLASGSQNYAPTTIAGVKLTPGEIRDLGIVSLGQGQSVTGVVRSTTTGLELGNIKVTARPSFGGDDLVVQSFTNQRGVYSLWVSTLVSNQFTLTAAPRDGNQASDGRYYGTVTLNNLNLQTQTTADFLLSPLAVVVTGQVLVADAATGGVLSYPFGDKRGFPAAAVNLHPAGVVPKNPLGDIEAATDARGFFTVPGLSTGIYGLHATSLGYAVFNATVQIVGSSFRIFTGSNTSTNDLAMGPLGQKLTLARGATLTGRVLKSDGSAPNSTEVAGVAAANFGAGEFVVGSVEVDPVAKTVNAYTISGFRTGVSYSIVLLSGSSGKEVSFPSEGAGVLFSAVESTATKTINLTYRPAELDCLGTAKALDAGRARFSVQIDCLKPLRQETAADDDLTAILTVSTFTKSGAALTAPNGAGVVNARLLSSDRRRLTANYTLSASESRFSMRVRASAVELDPNTGDSFAIDKVFDFYAGLDAHADGRATNIDGGAVAMQPSAQDELLGLAERSRIDLPPGAFAEGSNSLADSSVVANPTTTVNVSMSKGRDQALAKALSVASLGYAPAALEVADVPSAFPDEMWAAMSTYRTQASTTQVGGANPISAFYSIFLPAGIRHQLKERADLTLSYSLATSTATTDDKIQVYFYNAVLGRFVPELVNRRLDTVNKTITVSVDHFSTFVVLDSTPVATSTVSFGGADIAVANFPNPADCIVHSNITRNSTLFGSGGTHTPFLGTMIRTSIPLSGTPADLKFNIYNVAGEKVRTIEQGQVPAGQTYYTPWNCKNDAGQTVASGVYIGEAIHGGRRKFFKIAIIKGSGL